MSFLQANQVRDDGGNLALQGLLSPVMLAAGHLHRHCERDGVGCHSDLLGSF